MGTGAPESRKTHVTRIFGTNKKGERLDHLWADVERMDVIRSAMQVPPDRQWQGVQRKLRWCDNPDSDDYEPEGTPSRLTEIVKVCDPESQDVNDPDEWIPIRVIKGMKSRGGGDESMGDGYMDRFVSMSDEDQEVSRIVEVRRIVHYDTNIDEAAQAALDSNPDRKEYVVTGENYEKDTDNKDDDQYVEHEIITYLKHRGNTTAVMGEGRQTKLLNEYLIDASERAKQDTVGVNGINPPYRLDPFQNIINISFGGLAVEFSKESLLEAETDFPAFEQAVISLWVRVPQESIDAAKLRYDAHSQDDPTPPLLGIIPLVVFGRRGERQGVNITAGSVIENVYRVHDWRPDTGSWYEYPYPNGGWQSLFTENSGPGTRTAGDPSYIGVYCASGEAFLCFNFETGAKPRVAGMLFIGTGGSSSDYTLYGANAIDPSPEPPDPPPYSASLTVADVTSDGYTTGSYSGTCPGAKIKPDKWHHILMSVDLSPTCKVRGIKGSSVDYAPSPPPYAHVSEGVESAPKMWVAVDDANLTKGNLATCWPDGADDNTIVTNEAMGVLGQYNVEREITSLSYVPYYRKLPATDVRRNGMTTPTYSLSSGIPAGKIGTPGTSFVSDKIEIVELAELQFYTGVKLDTSELNSRRLFISDKGKPVSPSNAAKVLGEPTVLLHGNGNWMKGRSTGFLDMDFSPIGDIEKYKPDPSLFGPQNPPKK